jgi:CBS domain containing-hemolysin-like protein
MTLRRALGCTALTMPVASHASLLSGEALDTAADVVSWVVIVVVPVVVIGLFWIVHVMPEKIAEKRHHPHKDSIHVLCLLSLVFGGMLWPFAWLWAYTKPIGYRAVYGSEKHDDYYLEEGEKAMAGKLTTDQVEQLRLELAAMQSKGTLSPELRQLKDKLDRLPAAAMAPIHVLPPQEPAKVAQAAGGGS